MQNDWLPAANNGRQLRGWSMSRCRMNDIKTRGKVRTYRDVYVIHVLRDPCPT